MPFSLADFLSNDRQIYFTVKWVWIGILSCVLLAIFVILLTTTSVFDSSNVHKETNDINSKADDQSCQLVL